MAPDAMNAAGPWVSEVPGVAIWSPSSPGNLGCSEGLPACLSLHPLWGREKNWSAPALLF